MFDDIEYGTLGNYGGIWTDVITLPVGTKFHVENGHWDGEIIEIDGVKHIGGDVHIKCSRYPEGFPLQITIAK